ncbi:hypothetical protein LJC02_02235 [Breznakia sp. OttesenSCG-928-G09]|nr:hypothetical protein [Breznakia sp. OttesenSCG-928-G09]
MNSRQIHNITHAGLGLALILLAQSLNKLIPAIPIFAGVQVSQLITGTLVNTLLLLVSIDAGYRSGVAVAILSAVLATILGIGPVFPIITPFIAIGNVLYVGVFQYIFKRKYNVMISSLPAAFIKAGFLWVMIPIVLYYIPDINEVQALALGTMFSWPQLITAISGGIIASIVNMRIPKGSHEKNA